MSKGVWSLIWGTLTLSNGSNDRCEGSCQYHKASFAYTLTGSCHLRKGHTGKCVCSHPNCRKRRMIDIANSHEFTEIGKQKQQHFTNGLNPWVIDEAKMRDLAHEFGFVYNKCDFIVNAKNGKAVSNLHPLTEYIYVSTDFR